MSRRNSYLVGAGILLSRISGLVRQSLLARYVGLGDAADAFTAAFRIPNLLQNLFGEGALSASFIPSYSRLIEEGREEEARQLAGAVLALLTTTMAILVLVGELATPLLLNVLVGDWVGEKRALTERLVRILFPGAGLLVISAWCLGVLNSHRRFLLSYAAPVVWNAAMIVAILTVGRGESAARVTLAASVGSVIGSFLQIAVQWPVVRQVGGRIVLRSWRGVREASVVIRTFIPTMISRGANQLSAFIDVGIAAYLPTGAMAAIGAAQTLYTLPVSLFGMAITAAELPEMSRERGDDATVAMALRIRLDAATQRLAFYIVPSAMAFVAIGGVMAGAVYQSGRFTADDTAYVWLVLAGAAIGLLASTLGRLYSSAFYALRDATTPLRTGLVRVSLTAVLGVLAGLVLPPLLGLPARAGAAGLTISAGMAGWVEFMLLRRALIRRLGQFALPTVELFKLWGAAGIAGGVATGVRLGTAHLLPIAQALMVVPAFGATYIMLTSWLDIPEAAVLGGRVLARLRRRP
ncbi:MAG: murein biosynthesis integral membrane protein MurJ [Gemmatimonadota bacterium]